MGALEAIAVLLIIGSLAICIFIEVTAFHRLHGYWKLLVIPPLIIPVAIVGMLDETVFINVNWFSPEPAFLFGLFYMVVLTLWISYVLRKKSTNAQDSVQTTTLAEENGYLAATLTFFMVVLAVVGWLYYVFVLT